MTQVSLFWRERWKRRLSVACLYLGVFLALLLMVTKSDGSSGSLPLSLLVSLFVVVSLAGLAGVLQTQKTLFPDALGPLDERQRGVRNQAYVLAYRVLGLLVILSAGYALAIRVGRFRLPGLSSLEVFLLMIGAAVVVMTLPAAIMAWTEPDPPEDSGAYHMINQRSSQSRSI